MGLLLSALTCVGTRADAVGTIHYDINLLEYRVNSQTVTLYPGMQQALHLTRNFYSFSHLALEQTLGPRFDSLYPLAQISFDVLATWLPLGDAWMHEEWHRAVLSHRGITNSYNAVYDLEIFKETIQVENIRDHQLSELKRTHPQDLVRLHAAGIESSTQLGFLLEQDLFFRDENAHNGFMSLLSQFNSWFYLQACAGEESVRITQESLASEDGNELQRDFTGMDCNAWVYDLFRPDEAYSARGTHPSGTGILRYRSFNDLDQREKNYLKQQRYLGLVNLFNPFLYRDTSFTAYNAFTGKDFQWNVNIKHYLSSYGNSLGLNFYYRDSNTRLLLSPELYSSPYHHWPGLSVRSPGHWQWGIQWDLHLSLWMQAQRLRYDDDKAKPGMMIKLDARLPISTHWYLYSSMYNKSQGWYPGIVEQNPAFNISLGLSYMP